MINKEKQKNIIEILSETPFINYACKRVGISRATFYRFKTKNRKFAKEIHIAMNYGRDNFSEVSESMLMKKVKEGNLDAIKYALRHNNGRYHPLKPTPPIIDFSDQNDPFNQAFVRDYFSMMGKKLRDIEEYDND